MANPCTRRELALFAAGAFVLRLPALVWGRWYDPDEAAIAVQARTLVGGGRLYADMADRKPPIPPYLYALWHWLTGSYDPRGPRLMASVLLAVATVVLVREVARVKGPRVARWTGILYLAGAFAMAPVDGGAANYAHFALPLATLAVLACRRSGWAPLGGGLLLGLAVLSRQSWIFAVPAGAFSCWRCTRVRGTALFTVGLVAGVATAALMAPWSDYWFWNFKSSPGFVFASIGLGVAVGRGLAALGLFVARHLAMVGGAARALPSSLRTDPDLWLWVLTGTGATAAGFRFYGHYWLQVVPPLALLAGGVVAGWSRRWRVLAAWSVAVTAIVSLASLCVPTWFRSRPDPAALAARIDACTSTSDRVFVWGSYPELLMAVDRPVAGTLVHSDFVTGRSGGRTAATDAATPGARERMMADLDAAPPAVLVDTSGVADLGYTAFPMLGDPDLAAFARAQYTPEQVDGYTLWWRSGDACTAP